MLLGANGAGLAALADRACLPPACARRKACLPALTPRSTRSTASVQMNEDTHRQGTTVSNNAGPAAQALVAGHAFLAPVCIVNRHPSCHSIVHVCVRAHTDKVLHNGACMNRHPSCHSIVYACVRAHTDKVLHNGACSTWRI